jgi:hypothetical protein
LVLTSLIADFGLWISDCLSSSSSFYSAFRIPKSLNIRMVALERPDPALYPQVSGNSPGSSNGSSDCRNVRHLILDRGLADI